VLIPQAFWKIILLLRADGTHAVWGYDLPNVAALPGYARFVYALGDIEDISGLRFFSALMLSQRDRETAPNLPALNPLPADAAQAETIHKRK
jgi:DNA/RNA endonuclease G (NUC1)